MYEFLHVQLPPPLTKSLKTKTQKAKAQKAETPYQKLENEDPES